MQMSEKIQENVKNIEDMKDEMLLRALRKYDKEFADNLEKFKNNQITFNQPKINLERISVKKHYKDYDEVILLDGEEILGLNIETKMVENVAGKEKIVKNKMTYSFEIL